MSKAVSVNPFRCRMWSFHDRLETHLTEADCRAEIDSIERNGQLVPALGRPLKSEPDFDVELVYGARRLFVARHLNVPLLVNLQPISDRDAMIAMDIENRLRKDVSPYERGLSFARCLRSGCFRSQDELAHSLKISGAQVSRLLALAKLPAAIISAFSDPREIRESWTADLMKALEDPQRRRTTLDRARRLSEEANRRAADVFSELTSLVGASRTRKASLHDEVIKDDQGLPIFRIRMLRAEVALLFPAHTLSAGLINELRTTIRELLRERSGDPAMRHPAPAEGRRAARRRPMCVAADETDAQTPASAES